MTVKLKLVPNQFMRLINPLHGFTGSEDYWYHTITRQFRGKLNMEPTTGYMYLLTQSDVNGLTVIKLLMYSLIC